jgi:predicted restriction endonuclease
MRRDYKDPLYVKWRKAVYKRDNHQCQWPGCTSRSKLNAHHIKRWSDFPGLRFQERNGITLCYKHHKMIKDMEHIYEGILYKIVSKHYGI